MYIKYFDDGIELSDTPIAAGLLVADSTRELVAVRKIDADRCVFRIKGDVKKIKEDFNKWFNGRLFVDANAYRRQYLDLINRAKAELGKG